MLKKTKTTKRSRPRPPQPGLDYRAFERAMHDALAWALVVAESECRDLDDLEVVERVRTALHARLGGETAKISADDVMFAILLATRAVERDLDARGVPPPDVLGDLGGARHARRTRATSWLEEYLFHARARA
jgi:hypothetical protein